MKAINPLMLSALLALPSTSTADTNSNFSGKIYYNWTYNADDQAEGYNAFSLKRTYLTYQKNLSENMYIRLITDVYRPGAALNVLQKNAYVAIKMKRGILLLGLQGMNVFNVIENNWGYRFVAKSSLDVHKFASSADLGIGITSQLAENLFLHLTVTNGGGYKKPETDKYKKLALQAVYGERDLSKHTGFNAGGVLTYEPYDVTRPFEASQKESATVVALFGGIATESLKIGAEYDLRSYSESGRGSAQIVAATIDYKVSSNWPHLFGKIELYDGDTINDEASELSIIIGVNHTLGKGIHVAPNVQIERSADGEIHKQLYVINLEVKF